MSTTEGRETDMSHTHTQHGAAQGHSDWTRGYENSAKVTQRAQGFLFRLAVILLGLGFLLVFGFFFDRPSRVPKPDNEKAFATAGRLLSAGFHAVISLILVTQYGPLGFVSLALAVVIVARRRSAAHGAMLWVIRKDGVPYALGDLASHVAGVIGLGAARDGSESAESAAKAVRLKLAVVVAMGLCTVLNLLVLFDLPLQLFAGIAGMVTWALWMHIAIKAAGWNLAAADEDTKLSNYFIGILSKTFGGAPAEWESAFLSRNDDGDLVVDNPPLGAALKFSSADETLAAIAPDWELAPETTERRLVLREVSEETRNRREEEARSGGLIAGRIETGPGVMSAAAVPSNIT
ncbi:MAG TPA: hypothetical protein VF885_14865, partial [Arthrobacter sp.]